MPASKPLRNPSISSAILRAEALEKTYPPLTPGAPGLTLFSNLSLEVAPGEMVAVVGQSGAGKSTLLHLLAALDTPTSGSVHVGDTAVTALSPRQQSAFRNREIGYVWQFHYLLPEFTAAENAAMPLLARGVAKSEALATAEHWLARVGLAGRGHHRSGELSGGEQQRVSIARALLPQPKLLLADEPTGDLDTTTSTQVFELLQQLHREQNLASLIVTHNLDFAARCDRILRLQGGQLVPASVE